MFNSLNHRVVQNSRNEWELHTNNKPAESLGNAIIRDGQLLLRMGNERYSVNRLGYSEYVVKRSGHPVGRLSADGTKGQYLLTFGRVPSLLPLFFFWVINLMNRRGREMMGTDSQSTAVWEGSLF